MSELLFENPILISIVCILVCAIAWYSWIQSGNPWARNAAIGLTLLGVFLIWLNFNVKTDREKIESMVADSALELQNNEFAKLQKRIHPQSSDITKATVAMLPNAKFREARVTKIHSIEIETLEGVKTAVVRMNVVVDAEILGMNGKVPRWVRVTLEEQNGQWLIIDFEHQDPQYELVGRN